MFFDDARRLNRTQCRSMFFSLNRKMKLFFYALTAYQFDGDNEKSLNESFSYVLASGLADNKRRSF